MIWEQEKVVCLELMTNTKIAPYRFEKGGFAWPLLPFNILLSLSEDMN